MFSALICGILGFFLPVNIFLCSILFVFLSSAILSVETEKNPATNTAVLRYIFVVCCFFSFLFSFLVVVVGRG